MCIALTGAIEVFKADRMVFAPDFLVDPEGVPLYIKETIKCLGSLDIPEEGRKKYIIAMHSGRSS